MEGGGGGSTPGDRRVTMRVEVCAPQGSAESSRRCLPGQRPAWFDAILNEGKPALRAEGVGGGLCVCCGESMCCSLADRTKVIRRPLGRPGCSSLGRRRVDDVADDGATRIKSWEYRVSAGHGAACAGDTCEIIRGLLGCR